MSTPDLAARVTDRLAEVRERAHEAARRSGRSPHALTIVAVAKTFPPEVVAALRDAGHLDIGESRAQELVAKVDALGPGLRWHFVGRLQRNKVAAVVARASLVHSVDRLPLAEAIARHAGEQGKVQPVLVQVNVGADPAKAGFSLEEATEAVGRVRALDGLACQGLMTLPPLEGDPREPFARLRALRDELRATYPEVQHLSMGMSADFETAIEEGATMVRLGEAIFGRRDAKA